MCERPAVAVQASLAQLADILDVVFAGQRRDDAVGDNGDTAHIEHDVVQLNEGILTRGVFQPLITLQTLAHGLSEFLTVILILLANGGGDILGVIIVQRIQ